MNLTDNTTAAASNATVSAEGTATTAKKRGRKANSPAPNDKPEPTVLYSQEFGVRGNQKVVLKLYEFTVNGRFTLGRQAGKPSGALLAPEQFDFPVAAALDMVRALRDPGFETCEQHNEYQVLRVNHENGFTIGVREARSAKKEPKTSRVIKPMPGVEEITLHNQDQALWLAGVIEAEANTRVLPEGAADEMAAGGDDEETEVKAA